MWKNINITENQIEATTERSVLIKMPNNSDYADYKFWHPSKLVRGNRQMNFGYTDSFIFRAFKNGNGKHNRFEKVSEIELNAEDIEAAFGVLDESLKLAEEKHKEKLDKSFVRVAEPDVVNDEIQIDESLKN